MEPESSSDDQLRNISPPEVPKTPKSQVSGQDDAPSEEKEVQTEPIKDDEQPSTDETKEVQPEPTEVEQPHTVRQYEEIQCRVLGRGHQTLSQDRAHP